MRTFDIPYLADWVVSSLRWVMFLGITFGLAVSENLNLSNGGLLLLLAVLWNLFSTLLAILYRRLKAHRPINLTVDILICLALYGLNGGAAGPIAWVGALAICSAAIYYEWRGSLGTFIVLTLLEAGWGFLSQPGAFRLQAFLPVIA